MFKTLSIAKQFSLSRQLVFFSGNVSLSGLTMFGFWKYLDRGQKCCSGFSISIIIITIVTTIILLLAIRNNTVTEGTTTATLNPTDESITTTMTHTTSVTDVSITTTTGLLTTTTSGPTVEMTTTTSMSTSFKTTTLSTTTTSVTTTTTGKKEIIYEYKYQYCVDSSAEYLYLSHNKVLHIPDFTQITCQLNCPSDALLFGVAGLVKNGGEDRLMVCEDGCHLLTENEWELTNPSFRRCYLYK